MNRTEIMNAISHDADTTTAFARLRGALRRLNAHLERDDAISIVAMRHAPAGRSLEGALLWLGTRINDECDGLQACIEALETDHQSLLEAQRFLVRAAINRSHEIPREIEQLRLSITNAKADTQRKRTAAEAAGIDRHIIETMIPDFDHTEALRHIEQLQAEQSAIEAFQRDRKPERLPEHIHAEAERLEQDEERAAAAKQREKERSERDARACEGMTLTQRMKRLEAMMG